MNVCNVCFNCKECIHQKVCQTSKDVVPKLIHTVGGPIDNEDCPSMIEFQIICKEFLPLSNVKILTSR